MSASEVPALLPPGLAEDEQPFDLDAIHRRHGRWLFAFLRRRFGLQEAEDLAQETYLHAASARGEIRHPRAYLVRIALNTARNRARSRTVRPQLAPEGPRSAQVGTPADQIELLALKQTILSLPPKLRDVFLLSRFEGLTYVEIAQRCGVSVKTVEKRMTKALVICTARMRD